MGYGGIRRVGCVGGVGRLEDGVEGCLRLLGKAPRRWWGSLGEDVREREDRMLEAVWVLLHVVMFLMWWVGVALVGLWFIEVVPW